MPARKRDRALGRRGSADLDRRSSEDRARQDDGNRQRIHPDGFDELDPRRCGELRRPEPDFLASGRRSLRAVHWHERLALSVRFDRREDWCRGVVTGMTDRPLRRPSRSLRAQGLCKVTVLVPEGCAEGIRQFAQELRDRQPIGPVPETPLRWLALSPSAELIISPDCSARCSVRDTRAPGGGPLSMDCRGAETVGPDCRRAD